MDKSRLIEWRSINEGIAKARRKRKAETDMPTDSSLMIDRRLCFQWILTAAAVKCHKINMEHKKIFKKS